MGSSENNSPRQLAAGARLLRIGWWTTGAGVALAVAAAVLGAVTAGSTSFWGAAATVLHRLAAVIMLIGLVLVLLGYRMRQLLSWLSQYMEDPATQLPGIVAALLRLCCIMLPLLLLAIAAPWIMLVLLSEVISGTVILGGVLLVPGVLTAVLIYDRSWIRAFAIGAMFPAAAVFLATVLTIPSILDGYSTLGAYMNYRILDWLKRMGYVMIGVAWDMGVLSGLLAMAVRYWLLPEKSRGQNDDGAQKD